MKTNPKVDWFFDKPTQWQEAYRRLRKIVLGCGLSEALKWGVPCYTDHDKNIVLIHGFKEYCALLFPKGALLKDDEGVLIQQTKNVQAARQIRFESEKQVTSLQKVVKKYVLEAIALERSGAKVELKKTKEFEKPQEFTDKLSASPSLKKAFSELTPGRQRGYLLYFSSAKQSSTRVARIEKSVSKIMAGKGLDD